MEMKRKHLDIMVGIIFLILLALFFYLFQRSNECLADPLKYAAEKVSSENNDLICDCYFTDPSYARFYFDKEGIIFEGQRSP